jgi:ribonuclease D
MDWCILRPVNVNYIDQEPEFLDFLSHLNQLEAIAWDLEFDKNRFRYGFTMCLFQIATADEVFVIDPFAVDVTLLFPFFESPSKQKIGFELGEDVRLLKHMGCNPTNLLDLSVCTKLLGYSQRSLSNTLQDLLAVTSSKNSQKSNWINRPLSSDQIQYAAEDVAFLFDLKDRVLAQVVANGMEEWLRQECDALTEIQVTPQGPRSYVKLKDLKLLNEVELSVFESLLEFREKIASKYNRPAYQVLDRDFLLALAQRPSAIKQFQQDAKALRSLRTEAFRQELFTTAENSRKTAVANGLRVENRALPRQDDATMRAMRLQKRVEAERIEQAWKPIQAAWKERYGEEVGVYLLSNRLISELAAGNTCQLRPYKRALLLDTARQLGIETSLLGL